MATELCLIINDDGTFSVSQEEAEMETAEQQTGESEGQKFSTLDKAIAAIREMAQAASLNGDQAAQDMGTTEQADEESAMTDSFRPKY